MLKKFCILLFVVTVVQVRGQTGNDKIDFLVEDGEFYLEDKDYEKAYDCYDKLVKLDKKNIFFKFQKGMCAIHMPQKKSETIAIFEEVRKTEPNEPSVLYYLGRAYHANYKFEEAIKYFNEYLASKPKNKELKAEAEQFLTNSQFGQNLVKTMLDADIKNIGPPVNTKADEYVPVISADESVLIYTYRGPLSTGGLMNEKFKPDPKGGRYYEDVFISKRLADSTWSTPSGIGEEINTTHNDASIALSPDGQELFTFYSDEKNGGDIYVCHLSGDTWSKPEKLGPNINTKYWEGSCSITADGHFLYFSSEKPGGLGGKDLYVSEMQPDGEWGVAKNLGPSINTKYDEDAPFIHPDGITLFFSSEGHSSIGGYDIMYSINKEDNWMEPINMGYPLNTTDDDRYYVITAKGDRGYFSSNRESKGGNGSQDIFTVTPGVLGEKPVLAMVVGNIYGNDVPMGAQIEIIKKSTGEKIGPFRSNSKTGKYLIALSPGENYVFKIKAQTFPDYEEELDIRKITKFVEIRKDFHLVKDGFKDPHLDTIKKLNEYLDIHKILDTITVVPDSLRLRPDEVVKHNDPKVDMDNPCGEFKNLDFSALKGKSLNDPAVYKKLLAIGKKICSGRMIFKVQIAAYHYPKNYKWGHLKEYGPPEIIDYPDNITRFTQGRYANITEAEE
ncbi:MAG TPA: hypothetical protein VNX68_15055, partial [Nitrosopumilaceae archaeon]|nr:hypothetical protein [Nitrosopumilaceae archaeon]